MFCEKNIGTASENRRYVDTVKLFVQYEGLVLLQSSLKNFNNFLLNIVF